eukprot:CAMPEP_0175145174 /NCGR_PEP_ID=MMETSP0087-20121206/14600_1 /TAXON_ID=136419 /ORGANISM="Unknown Unknown, Strain D1" /LENGTH=389 /DNA_ID=CAMNT_0016429843 /DNA_START=37 /DNA_END=1206 /DNA_ORIENTATION=+
MTDSDSFFEGPEKLLEIWFSYEGDDRSKTLRDIPRDDWVPMLQKVNCLILSSVSNKCADAYLLSESSFFVFDYKLILKTCGTTTLLAALRPILELAKRVHLTRIESAFYSRQNFFFPEHQLTPHRSFKDETQNLANFFGPGGSPLMLGRIDGNHYKFWSWENQGIPDPNDITIEILMTGLSEQQMKRYFYKHTDRDQKPGDESGISTLLQGLAPDEDYKSQVLDEFVFEPFGYSMNALLGPSYYTVHVTPQNVCSYASFECNVNLDNYSELTARVLEVFHPTDFMVVIVSTKEDKGFQFLPQVANFKARERCMYSFETFNISYQSFSSESNKPASGKPKELAAVRSLSHDRLSADKGADVHRGPPRVQPSASGSGSGGAEEQGSHAAQQ